MLSENQPIQVLLVHHSEAVYSLTENLLRVIPQQPYHLIACTTLEEAREQLKAAQADIALIDDACMDREALAWLQSRETRQPVIVLVSPEEDITSTDSVSPAAPETFGYLRQQELSPQLLDYAIRYACQQYALGDTEARKEMLLSVLSHRLKPSIFAEHLVLTQFIQGFYGPMNLLQTSMLTELLKSNRFTAVLLDNLAELQQSESMRATHSADKVDINRFLRHLVEEEYEGLIREKQHQITLQLGEGLSLYPGKLEQAFRNVIQNAILYTPQHGQIEIKTAIDDDSHWVFSIRDNGPGIPAEILPILFAPRKSKTLASRLRDSGLGLYATRKIIQSHAGQFSFSSSPEDGCSVLFSLPLKIAN